MTPTPTILETKMNNDSQKAVIESKKKEFYKLAWEVADMAHEDQYPLGKIDELWSYIITNFQPKDEKR